MGWQGCSGVVAWPAVPWAVHPLCPSAPVCECMLARFVFPKTRRHTAPSPPPSNAHCLQDLQRPLYMQPKDAIAYGVCDGIVTPERKIVDDVKKPEEWDREAGLVQR